MKQEKAIELISGIFRMPKPREEKCRTLFDLAQRSTGDIVELGTYHGNGATALCLGKSASQLVYTVDDYAIRTGWAGETYGPHDKQKFFSNCEKAGVYPILVEKNFLDAAKIHTNPIGMLYWDSWYQLNETLAAWFPMVSSGGIVAIHETIGTERFGARDWMTGMTYDGKLCQYKVMSGGVHVGVKI